MSNDTQTDLLDALRQRLLAEARFEGGDQAPWVDGLRAGYRDAARMISEVLAESRA